MSKIGQQREGQVVSIRGSVIDVKFEGAPPPVHTLLRGGQRGEMLIEVLSHLEPDRIRGIAYDDPGSFETRCGREP